MATLEAEVHVMRGAEMQVVPCFPFDAIVDLLPLDGLSVVKIDVEGHEGEVLAGMIESLRRWRPPVLCEVLDYVPGTDPASHAHRVATTDRLVRTMNYRIVHLHTREGSSSWTWNEVATLPVRTWSRQSTQDCDYLFVPAETWDQTTRLL